LRCAPAGPAAPLSSPALSFLPLPRGRCDEKCIFLFSLQYSAWLDRHSEAEIVKVIQESLDAYAVSAGVRISINDVLLEACGCVAGHVVRTVGRTSYGVA